MHLPEAAADMLGGMPKLVPGMPGDAGSPGTPGDPCMGTLDVTGSLDLSGVLVYTRGSPGISAVPPKYTRGPRAYSRAGDRRFFGV